MKTKRVEKEYRGMRYRITRLDGASIFEGVDDCGIRVVFAMSVAEFKKKADAFIDDGESQYLQTDTARRSYKAVRKVSKKRSGK